VLPAEPPRRIFRRSVTAWFQNSPSTEPIKGQRDQAGRAAPSYATKRLK
jgi:hypothetical protein